MNYKNREENREAELPCSLRDRLAASSCWTAPQTTHSEQMRQLINQFHFLDEYCPLNNSRKLYSKYFLARFAKGFLISNGLLVLGSGFITLLAVGGVERAMRAKNSHQEFIWNDSAELWDLIGRERLLLLLGVDLSGVGSVLTVV